MKRIEKFNLDMISRYRGELFGLSIIGIIIYHYFCRVKAQFDSGFLFELADFYDNVICSVGVECFLFLSGMGLFFSMTKDSNALHFYTKRLKRVLIPYAIWGGVFWIIRDLLFDKTSVARFLYDFSFLSFLTEGEKVIWYIFFIAVMYLVFPLVFKVLSIKKNAFAGFLLMLCVGMATPVLVKIISPELYENIEVAVSRIPIFLLGAYYGKRIYNHDNIKTGDIILVILGIVFHIYSVLSRYEIIPTGTGLFRYEFALFSVSIIFICVWLFSRIKCKLLHSALKSVGAVSLELYMTHVTIDNLMRFCKIPTYEIWYYILCVILSIIFSFLLHFALKNIIIKVGKAPNKI